ncbi:hypothetical protein V1477_007263 [Vespula maculifrons]|uniref:Uncharacterized protein n=1 Tax=Vespula maculifrons TaxID=7453 RepID=A0ABD2CI85_VESMC
MPRSVSLHQYVDKEKEKEEEEVKKLEMEEDEGESAWTSKRLPQGSTLTKRLALLYAVVRSVNGFCEPDPTDKPPPPTSPPTQPLTSRPITSASTEAATRGPAATIACKAKAFSWICLVRSTYSGRPRATPVPLFQTRNTYTLRTAYRQEPPYNAGTPSARPNRSVTEKTEISLRNNRYTTPVKDKPPMAAPRPRLRQ